MTASSKSSKKRQKRIPFPQQLFELLKLAEADGLEDIISWVDDGKGFKVHDRKKFEDMLLTQYFNTTRYSSFTRQLHAYDFNCVRTGRQTGIYFHSDFTRDNPEGSCSLQREASKIQSRKAINNGSKNQSNLGIRAGDTIVQFPTLLRPRLQDDASTLSSTSDDSNSTQFSMVTGLYHTVCSKIGAQTRKSLIRIPPEAVDNRIDHSEDVCWSHSDRRMPEMSGIASPNSPTVATATRVSEGRGGSSVRRHHLSTMIPIESEEEDGDDDLAPVVDDDFEPLPWSPSLVSDDDDDIPMDQSKQLDTVLEPRPIQDMVQSPQSLNTEWWYETTPMFDSPRKRAILEFSLPFTLPLGFYLLNVSKFGIYWVTFLILGHLVQSLYTAWGGSAEKTDKTYTKDFSIKSSIGVLQHHIMDMLWVHSLLSNMMLTPEYFGPPCFLLLYLFTWALPINLAIVIKTHYCESNLEGTYAHEKHWIGDLSKKVFLGYGLTMLGVFVMDVFEMHSIRIPVVFGFNMIPLFAFESYRYLLSIPAMPAIYVTDAKKVN